jgi:ribonucleotide monophosphatase NagD (HAD superfamily)
MLGDDLEADIQGAQAVGMKGVLVQTGKYRPDLAAQIPVTPDAVIADIGAIAAWL